MASAVVGLATSKSMLHEEEWDNLDDKLREYEGDMENRLKNIETAPIFPL
jgi:hypothetical protein